MELKAMWQNKETGQWQDFDLNDILHMSRDNAIDLFSFSIPVIAKHDNIYIVNNKTLCKQYQHNRKTVKLFSDLEPSKSPLGTVGFI